MKQAEKHLLCLSDWLNMTPKMAAIAGLVASVSVSVAGMVTVIWDVSGLHSALGMGTLSPLQCAGVGLAVTCLGLLQLDPIAVGH